MFFIASDYTGIGHYVIGVPISIVLALSAFACLFVSWRRESRGYRVVALTLLATQFTVLLFAITMTTHRYRRSHSFLGFLHNSYTKLYVPIFAISAFPFVALKATNLIQTSLPRSPQVSSQSALKEPEDQNPYRPPNES